MEELKIFAVKLLVVLIMAPLGGWVFLQYYEKVEKAWKSGNRKKRWVILSGVFIFLAILGGWLR